MEYTVLLSNDMMSVIEDFRIHFSLIFDSEADLIEIVKILLRYAIEDYDGIDPIHRKFIHSYFSKKGQILNQICDMMVKTAISNDRN